jgi:hypothetical protein
VGRTVGVSDGCTVAVVAGGTEVPLGVPVVLLVAVEAAWVPVVGDGDGDRDGVGEPVVLDRAVLVAVGDGVDEAARLGALVMVGDKRAVGDSVGTTTLVDAGDASAVAVP